MKMRAARKVWIALLFSFGSVIAIHAQQPDGIPRLGFLGVNSPVVSKDFIDAFRQGLRGFDYVEGKNIQLELRWADGKADRLPRLAAELVALNVNVIFAAAAPSIIAARDATAAIPIVFEMLGDPVSAGIVKSLAKPGANLTGIAGLAPELSGKRIELLKQAISNLGSVATLGNPENPNFSAVVRESANAASGLQLRHTVVTVRRPAELQEAFKAVGRARAEAVSVVPDPMLLANQRTVMQLAAGARLPAIYGISGVVENGGLMGYSPSQKEMWRRAAYFVDKILKGARPGDLPVEQPTKFELVINLRTAKNIGVTIPPNLLARADRVIR
jgi:putative ABC transport system substrate-binding protein